MVLAGCAMRWRRIPLLPEENLWLFIIGYSLSQSTAQHQTSYREHSEEVYCLFEAVDDSAD